MIAVSPTPNATPRIAFAANMISDSPCFPPTRYPNRNNVAAYFSPFKYMNAAKTGMSTSCAIKYPAVPISANSHAVSPLA